MKEKTSTKLRLKKNEKISIIQSLNFLSFQKSNFFSRRHQSRLILRQTKFHDLVSSSIQLIFSRVIKKYFDLIMINQTTIICLNEIAIFIWTTRIIFILFKIKKLIWATCSIDYSRNLLCERDWKINWIYCVIIFVRQIIWNNFYINIYCFNKLCAKI